MCSGGNKRKLSTGIALVGNPPVVFLVSLIIHTYNYYSCAFIAACDFYVHVHTAWPSLSSSFITVNSVDHQYYFALCVDFIIQCWLYNNLRYVPSDGSREIAHLPISLLYRVLSV